MSKKVKYKGYVINILDPRRKDQIAGLKRYIDQREAAKIEVEENEGINKKTLAVFTEAMKAINAGRKS